MKASLRALFAEAIRNALSKLCHIQFHAYPSFERNEDKFKPACRYYFSPDKFHFAKSADGDAKRVGFIIQFLEKDFGTESEI